MGSCLTPLLTSAQRMRKKENKMYATTLTDEKKRQIFAQKAAEAFSKDKNLYTFSEKDITSKDVPSGGFFAVRWGIMDRSVLVFKIDEEYPVINYRDLVQAQRTPEAKG